MHIDFLDTLHCPYCDSKLRTVKIIDSKADTIEYGIVECNCFSYPVVGGILYLKIDSFNAMAKDCLSINKKLSALHQLIISRRSLKDKIFDRIRRYSLLQEFLNNHEEKTSGQSIVRLSSMNLYQTVDALNWGTWGDYVKYRYSADSFFETLPFLSLLKDKEEYALDHSCGLGHYSNVIQEAFPLLKIVCTDMNFSFLWLTKKHCVNNAQLLCLDEAAPLPFPDNSFTGILNSDAFPYFVSKALLAKEFHRVISPAGIIILTHLHNPLAKQWKGMPIPPSAYTVLFKGLPMNVIPGKSAVEGLFADSLDFSKRYDSHEIDSSDSVNIIISENVDVFRSRTNIRNDILVGRGNLIINPIYEITEQDNSLNLKMRMPNPFYEEDNPFLRKYLPKEYTIHRQEITHEKMIQDMVDRFILVNVPASFVAPDNTRRWDMIKSQFSPLQELRRA